MTEVDTRSVARDSLFLLADFSVEDSGQTQRIRVRNLSNGGMMGEGNLPVRRGDRVRVELRNIGTVRGSIAWVQDNRFGIAFDEEVDSQAARSAPGSSSGSEMTSRAHRAPRPPEPQKLRKI